MVSESGIAALDLQHNGISEIGSAVVEEILTMNFELVIVDLRNNDVGKRFGKGVLIRVDNTSYLFLQMSFNGPPSATHFRETSTQHINKSGYCRK